MSIDPATVETIEEKVSLQGNLKTVIKKVFLGTDYFGDPEYKETVEKFVIDTMETGLLKKNNPNLEIVPPKANELQLDYDCNEIPQQFQDVLEILHERFIKAITYQTFRSASKKHWHVVITLPEEIDNRERIMWQALFGSDYVREGLSFLRDINGIPNPSVLYMYKDRIPEESVTIPAKPARKFRAAQ